MSDARLGAIEHRLTAIEVRQAAIETRLDGIEANVNLAINYMREIATIIGARERLAQIDRDLADVQRRDTDPAPAGDST